MEIMEKIEENFVFNLFSSFIAAAIGAIFDWFLKSTVGSIVFILCIIVALVLLVGPTKNRKLRISLFVVVIIFLVIGIWNKSRSDIQSKLDQVIKERDVAIEKLKGWEFATPMYEKIPGDIDFLSRGHRIYKDKGSEVQVGLPVPGENFEVVISSIVKQKSKDGNDEYAANIKIIGNFKENNTVFANNPNTGISDYRTTIISPKPSPPIVLKREELIGPLWGGGYDFYIYVDDEKIDYFEVTIGRRVSAIKSKNLNISYGSLNLTYAEQPSPILLRRPE